MIGYRPRPSGDLSEQYIRNSKECTLYRIPPEILLLITDYSSESGRMALARAGRRLYHVLGPGDKSASRDELKTFKAMILRDDFDRKCQAERALQRPTRKILCSSCLKSHSKSAFTKAQICQPPESRVCVAGESKLVLCKHHTFTFSEVKRLPDDFVCADCRRDPSLMHYSRLGYAFRTETSCISTSRGFVSQSCFPLIENSRDWSMDGLREALVDLDVMMCPHFRSGDPVILRNFARSQLFAGSGPYDESRLSAELRLWRDTRPLDNSWSRWVSCRGCGRDGFYVSFDLWPWPLNAGAVILRVTRSVCWRSVTRNDWQARKRGYFERSSKESLLQEMDGSNGFIACTMSYPSNEH